MNLCLKLSTLLPAFFLTSFYSNASAPTVYNPSTSAFAGNVLIASNIPQTINTPPKVNKPRLAKFYGVKGGNLGSSCVNYAHSVLGIKQPIGAAKNQPMNSDKPEKNSIVVTRESSLGHLAIVQEVREDGIVVKEANYNPGQITSGRFIAFSSGKIRGYYKKVPTP